MQRRRSNQLSYYPRFVTQANACERRLLKVTLLPHFSVFGAKNQALNCGLAAKMGKVGGRPVMNDLVCDGVFRRNKRYWNENAVRLMFAL